MLAPTTVARVVACVGFFSIAVGVAGAQHGGTHLPPTARNVQLVGKLRLTSHPGGIGDVAALKGFAYVAAWVRECPNAGVHVVDLRSPPSPKKVAFVAAPAGYYVGEGVHVISVRTSSFKGDVLLANHEACPGNENRASGGFSLADVTNPRTPRPLTGLAGDVVNLDGTARALPNGSHSVQAWTAGSRAFAALVDNVERDGNLDIFDISNPRQPRQIAEYSLPASSSARSSPARGADVFIHDIQVETIGRRRFMLVSYWDAGWVLLDIGNPARPRFLRSAPIGNRAPFTRLAPAEGNAHQAFWSSSKRFILGVSEDFEPHRGLVTLAGSFAGQSFDAFLAGRATTPEFIQSPQLGRDPLATYYVGRACARVPEARSAPAVALIERGDCPLPEKLVSIANAGYAAAVVFDAAVPGQCEAGFRLGAPAGAIPAFTIARSAGFRILGIQDYDAATCSSRSGSGLPPAGTRGVDVVVRAVFDGWGHVTLLNAGTLEKLGYYAVREARDERFASGVGWLSVHEVKTDPRPGVNLAYLSYYGAGARVLAFDRRGMREVGSFIDRGGNNFWGTFPVRQGRRPPLWLLSDMDYGLYVLRYTGRTNAPRAGKRLALRP